MPGIPECDLDQVYGVVVENSFVSLIEMFKILFFFLRPFVFIFKAVQVGGFARVWRALGKCRPKSEFLSKCLPFDAAPLHG